MSEPVEVWCVVLEDGGIRTVFAHEIVPDSGECCERRLLVKPGETWQDGVKKCRSLLLLLGYVEDGVLLSELSALSPTPPEPS